MNIKTEQIWDEVKNMKYPRKEFYYRMLCDRGLTLEQAKEFVDTYYRVKMGGITRSCRKLDPKKNKEKAEEFRRDYCPNPARQAMNDYEKLIEITKGNTNSPNTLFD